MEQVADADVEIVREFNNVPQDNIDQNTTDIPQHGTEDSGATPQNQTLAPQLYSELVEAMRNLRQVQETQGKMLESLIKEESATKFTIFASLFDWCSVKSKIIQNENKIDCLCDCDSPQGEIGNDKVKIFMIF